MKRIVLIAPCCALLSVAGCTTPDVGTELKTTTTAFAALKAETRPALSKASEQERKAAEEQLILDGRPVLETRGFCQPVGAGANIEAATADGPCRVVSHVDLLSGPINATQVIALETALEVYLQSLVALNDASSANEVQTQTGHLILALKSLSEKTESAALSDLADKAVEEKARITGAVGMIVNQMRHRALVNAVSRGEKVIRGTSVDLYAFYERRNPRVSEAALALSAAEGRMTKARLQGSEADYRASIKAFRGAFADFAAKRKADPANWYLAFAEAHSALHHRLKTGAGIDDLIETIDALRALKPRT